MPRFLVRSWALVTVLWWSFPCSPHVCGVSPGFPISFHLPWNACLWICVWMSPIRTVFPPHTHRQEKKTSDGAWKCVMILILTAVHVWRPSESVKRFLSEKVSWLTCGEQHTNCTSCLPEKLLNEAEIHSTRSFLQHSCTVPVWMTKAVGSPCAAQTKVHSRGRHFDMRWQTTFALAGSLVSWLRR